MNLKQLELKRLRELLGAIRTGRHMAQAMRTPIARLVRFDKATASGINRIVAKWEAMGLREPIDTFDRSFGDDPIDQLKVHTEELAKAEKKISSRIVKLEKDPLLHASAAEIKKARKKTIARRGKAEGRLRATSEKRIATRMIDIDEQAKADFQQLQIDTHQHPRQWLETLELLKRAYSDRNWPQFAHGIAVMMSIGSPTDVETLSNILIRSREAEEERGKS
jgi:hypothetical protein